MNEKCTNCGGTGKIDLLEGCASGCPLCHGTGYINGKCVVCNLTAEQSRGQTSTHMCRYEGEKIGSVSPLSPSSKEKPEPTSPNEDEFEKICKQRIDAFKESLALTEDDDSKLKYRGYVNSWEDALKFYLEFRPKLKAQILREALKKDGSIQKWTELIKPEIGQKMRAKRNPFGQNPLRELSFLHVLKIKCVFGRVAKYSKSNDAREISEIANREIKRREKLKQLSKESSDKK